MSELGNLLRLRDLAGRYGVAGGGERIGKPHGRGLLFRQVENENLSHVPPNALAPKPEPGTAELASACGTGTG